MYSSSSRTINTITRHKPNGRQAFNEIITLISDVFYISAIHLELDYSHKVSVASLKTCIVTRLASSSHMYVYVLQSHKQSIGQYICGNDSYSLYVLESAHIKMQFYMNMLMFRHKFRQQFSAVENLLSARNLPFTCPFSQLDWTCKTVIRTRNQSTHMVYVHGHNGVEQVFRSYYLSAPWIWIINIMNAIVTTKILHCQKGNN